MLHFFARFGKRREAKTLLPFLGLVSGASYTFYHIYGHNLTRDLLSSEIEPGKRAEIFIDLKKLIISVYDAVQYDFNKELLPFAGQKRRVPVIKWFASSTMEPVTVGMVDTRSGALIGLPSHYNYDKIEDLPRSLLEVRRFNLFKSFSKKSNVNKENLQQDLDRQDCEIDSIQRIDPNSEAGREYLDSLILSEKAKRFSIARELFVADSYRPLLISGAIISSMLISVAISRLVVYKFRLLDRHLSQRLPFYAVSGTAGVLNFYCLSDSVNRVNTEQADLRAMKTGEVYREGAVEYFTKVIQRHKALRSIFEDFKSVYDKEGNLIDPRFRWKYVPLTERLETAKTFKPDNASV